MSADEQRVLTALEELADWQHKYGATILGKRTRWTRTHSHLIPQRV